MVCVFGIGMLAALFQSFISGVDGLSTRGRCGCAEVVCVEEVGMWPGRSLGIGKERCQESASDS